ncbi:titin-like [Anopheles albimanus]|uniref:Uncharacterized protein n=1 Tax=Anopheles albimanus TaxID=7167 RepID=A0A8W7K7C2_ANOAL|nr:titin-like [Anopheles albimanus]
MAPTLGENIVPESESPNFRKSLRNPTPNEKYRQFIGQAQARQRRTRVKNSGDASVRINLAAESDDATLPTTRYQATRDASPVREDRHSNVTRRTKPGRGRSVPASKQDVSEHEQPIVLKDCFILLTDISKDISLADRQQEQVTAIRPHRNVLDKNVTKSRTKRKQSDTTVPIDVSPPKQPIEESIVEVIPNPPVQSIPVPVQMITMTTNPAETTHGKGRAAKENNPFGVLIVSVKRLAPALSKKALQTLHNPEQQLTETIRELEATQRQSVRETNRFSSATVPAKRSIPGAIPEKKARITFAKSPKIIVTPCPSEESSAPHDSSATAPAPRPTAESILFVKPERSANRRKEFGLAGAATLPLLLEDEDEESDVYEFLSSSQTVETGKGKEKKSKKPKTAPQPRRVKKKDGPKNPAPPKPVKPARVKREPTKQNRGKQKSNPFGCNTKDIAKLVKKIGGGPVKTDHQPVDYVVNLDIEDFFHEPPFGAGRSNDIPALKDGYSFEAPLPVPSPKRAANPTLERLRNPAPLSLPMTSTPAAANDVRSKGKSLVPPPPTNVVSPLNVGSPWRLQDDHIVPPSRYVPRNREMLPSYDSHQNVPAPPIPSAIANVTERRKTDAKTQPPEVEEGKVGAVGTPPPAPTRPSLPKKALSPEEVLSETNFREIERMYNELKATSAMSEKLIGVMRKYKHNMRHPSASSTEDARQYEGNMREACQKLRQWYTRSLQSFNRSMHIINQIQRGVTVAGRAAACPSPLSQAQQQTVENFNQSTDHFRSMLDELRDAMNDSNDENRSPPGGQPVPIGAGNPSPRNPTKPASKGTKDVIVIPERGHITTRNPLKSLNFVPLPQPNSPLMSPLAKPIPPSPAPLRRELQFDQTPTRVTVESSRLTASDKTVPQAERSPTKRASVVALPENDIVIEDSCEEFAAEPSFDDTPEEEMENVAPSQGNHSAQGKGSSNAPGVDDLFGFDEESYAEEVSEPQITLPMPLNISAATLKKRLNGVKQLLPERPIFRERPLERTSGPTRLPTTTRLLRGVFSSPEKRSTRTLHAFAASTPRVAQEAPAQSDGAEAGGDHQPPNVSAIETPQPREAENDDENDQLLGSVVLFDEPQNTFDRSTLQRTYTRIPRRKRAKNIYLANLGLSDDDEDGALSDDPIALSSDSDAEAQAARKKKEKQKKERRKARKKPVEETKEFKQFVEEFNSMCEEVERFEVIIE